MAEPMLKCEGCGFHRERGDIVEFCDELGCGPNGTHALACRKCTGCPDMQESYRRGFNAGLDAMKQAVTSLVENSNLRKHPREAKDG